MLDRGISRQINEGLRDILGLESGGSDDNRLLLTTESDYVLGMFVVHLYVFLASSLRR